MVSTAGGTGIGTATATGRAPGFVAGSTTGRFALAADRGHPTVLAFVQAGVAGFSASLTSVKGSTR